jgi:myo-inositol 2-dehydrogenase/D-chiro-inositol 1-dehydrogenase
LTRLVGIVGAGRIGHLHAANAARCGLAVDRVVDARPEAAAELADQVGARVADGFDGLDAVVVCSPPDTHAEFVEAAAAAGAHVFCEKPLAPDLAGCDRAIEACERAGVVLQVGFQRRFDASFRALREAVESGRIGEPVLLRTSSRDPYEPPPTYGASIFVDSTIHDLDLARFLVGSEIVEVSARAAKLATPDPHSDTAVTTLAFANGALGAIDNCWQSAYGYDQRVEVHGTAGMAAAANEQASTTVVADGEGFHAPLLPHFFLERYAAAYVRELEAFAAAIDGGPVPVDGRDGRAALAAALAAKQSAEQGGAPVRLA